MKSIYFPSPVADDMVRAILEGRKTVTRRVVKPQLEITPIPTFGGSYRVSLDKNLLVKPPYRPGQILYVRETWAPFYETMDSAPVIGYRYYAETDEEIIARLPEYLDWFWPGRWYPSIHMPREAARIFLRVTDVRVERLQDITDEQARANGAEPFMMTVDVDKPDSEKRWVEKLPALVLFPGIWDSTIKPKDRALYGWEANPFVWRIEFDRCEKPEEDT